MANLCRPIPCTVRLAAQSGRYVQPTDTAERSDRGAHGTCQGGVFLCYAQRGRAVGYTAEYARNFLTGASPTPPLVIFACLSASFAGVSALFCGVPYLDTRRPRGGHSGDNGVAHPLTNYFSAVALLQGLSGEEKRIGSILLEAHRRASTARNAIVEIALRDVEGKREDRIDLPELKCDQVLMYALLGDPATQLKLPDTLEASVERTVSGWSWKAVRPPGATALEAGLRPEQSRAPLAIGHFRRLGRAGINGRFRRSQHVLCL